MSLWSQLAAAPPLSRFGFALALALLSAAAGTGIATEWHARGGLPGIDLDPAAASRVYLEAKQGAPALAELEAAARIEWWNGARHRNLGTALVEYGDLGLAIEALETASRLAPQDADTWANLGAALYFANRPADALPPLETALELAPEHPEATRTLHAVRRQLRTGPP